MSLTLSPPPTCGECVYFDEHAALHCSAPLPMTLTGSIDHFRDSFFTVEATTNADDCEAFFADSPSGFASSET